MWRGGASKVRVIMVSVLVLGVAHITARGEHRVRIYGYTGTVIRARNRNRLAFIGEKVHPRDGQV